MLIVLTFILNAGLNFALGLAVAAVLGPAEYGRFAVASMVAIVLATGLFDWLRLSATRFYTERARLDDPRLRASLEAGYWGIGAVVGAVSISLAGLGLTFGLGSMMLLAAAAAALANARFDFATALTRARFLERSHAVLMGAKNLGAFALMIGAAFWFGNATAVMAALALSAVLALAPSVRVLRDRGASVAGVDPGRLGRFARYGFPIVIANVIYQVIVLANRSIAAADLGYAQAGQLSLPTDMSIRLLLAVGAALDVYLFQLVIRRESTEGRAGANQQVIRNMLIVGSVLVLLAVGYATAMPAFTAVVAPPSYRGDFGPVSLVLIPGILAFCLVNFALNPVFQLEGRTGPVVWAALAALGTDAIGLAILPHGFGVMTYAAVHSASLCCGFVVAAGLAFRTPECRPALRDVAGIGLAACITALTIWPTRALGQPVLAMLGAAVVGAPVYLAVLSWFDIAGIRGIIAGGMQKFRRPAHLRNAATGA